MKFLKDVLPYELSVLSVRLSFWEGRSIVVSRTVFSSSFSLSLSKASEEDRW